MATATTRMSDAKTMGRYISAVFISFIVWFGLSFLLLLIAVFTPQYPPQGHWVELACGVLGLPAAVYAWRARLRRQPASTLTKRSQAITLIVLSLFWWLLCFLLEVVRNPVSKDAMNVGILLFFIVGPIQVVLALHFALKIYRDRFSLLYVSAIALALSPLLVFFFLVFSS